ncbi:MAG: hypothetical protein M3547_01860, partial [Acidobacteriota bacterium]|nr:hypothetical protein [Acidobacteriota bacterium]
MKRKATRKVPRRNGKTASKTTRRKGQGTTSQKGHKRASVRHRRRVLPGSRTLGRGRRGIVPFELEILEDDPKFKGVCNVKVPGIYGSKGQPLPKRMAK